MHGNITHSEDQLVLFLVWMICIFLGFFLFFLVTTFIKRSIKLRTQRKNEAHQKITDEILFNLLFGTNTLEESLNKFNTLERNPYLRSTMTRSLISLHRNYSGEQRTLLELFFMQSDLADFSLKKLKSFRWVDIVEGIRVLSVLNVPDAFEVIKPLLKHSSNHVKKEAFIGLITLKGTQGLEQFQLPEIVVDDWTQSCILYQLKIRHVSFTGIDALLNSQNDSLVLLGARIADYFQLHQYYKTILGMQRELQPKYNTSLQMIREHIIKTANL